MDKLKNLGPYIDPWKTPEIVFLKLLWVSLTGTLSVRFFTYEKTKANISIVKL